MTYRQIVLSTLCALAFGGLFNQAHGAQAAIAQACTTSRSLAADGLNAWMSNRDTINYIGLGLFCANALWYAWNLPQYLGARKKLDSEGQKKKNADAILKATTDFGIEQERLDLSRNCLYPIALTWFALTLKPEALLGVITSYVVWQHKSK
jgi:hypothetical protein